MGNTSSGAVAPTKKRALPLVIVLVMAVLAGLVMLYATVANGYEDSSYSPMQKPVSVEKQLEPGTEPSGDTLFEYELIVSPQYANDRHNQIDKGSSAVTSVTGTVYDVTYDADGKATLALVQAVKGEGDKYFINGMAAATEWDGTPTPGKVSVAIQDHKVNFSLKAGQRIVFENMPFAHKDADCGFVVNELIGDDSAAAQAGYGFSKVLVTEGAQYETTDKAYTDVVTSTGTLAKALYDSYTESVYAYFDADGNEVTKPNCTWGDAVSVYFNTVTDPDKTNWAYNYYKNGTWIYCDAAGNPVSPFGGSDGEHRTYYYKDGNVITPNWASYRAVGTVDHATEVLFLNKMTPSFKSLAIAKALEGDDAVADNTDFEFELIISPEQIGTKYAVADTVVDGITYDADGTQALNTYTMENQRITFKLKAGQRIEFPKMPFSRADGDAGKFIVNELEGEALTEYGYSYSKTDLVEGAAWNGAAVAGLVGKGTAGQTIPEGMTLATVYNKQKDPVPDEPLPPAGGVDYAAITVSKALEGAVQSDGTIFNFELISSPSFKGTPNTLEEGMEVEGITYGANGSVQSATYKVADNTIKFSLKAGESISFPKLPYVDLDTPSGKFIVNELGAVDAKGNPVEGYEFKYVELAKDTRLDATEDKVADMLKPAGTYGQLTADGDTRVKFVNARIPEEPEYPVEPEDITKSFSVTKSLVQDTTYNGERFPFEAIISPETIGVEGDLISGSVITGTVTTYEGKVVSTTEYIVGDDHAVYFTLKDDETMTFTGIPSTSMDVDELIVVNELALDEELSKKFYLAHVAYANIYSATTAQEQQFDALIQKGTTGKNAGALLKFDDGNAAVTFFNANPQPPRDEDPEEPGPTPPPSDPQDPGTPGDPDQPLTPQAPTDPTPSNPTTPGSYLPRTPTNMTPVGEEILDDGVPLASFVQTGDENTTTFIVLFALEGLSIVALIVLMILKRHDRKLALARARHGA
ncbi:MAG: hypothetical protein V8R08_05025 [Coriobacteriales bacterium]